MKSARSSLSISRNTLARAALLSVAGFAGIAAHAAPAVNALPTGEQVAAGSASFVRSGNNLTVAQGTDKAVINWQNFDIGSDAAVRFNQPTSSSVALNRVLGSDASQIFGSLSSNGKVFLVNPHGVFFGRGAQVNVGGLVASSLNISDDDFLASHYRFSAAPDVDAAAVINAGTITTADHGAVALLGGRVENNGVIVARLGSVALGAGNAVSLDFAGDGLISLQVDAGAVNALAANHGLIRADGGSVLLTSKSADALIRSVVNNDGIIEAHTLENRAGKIVLLGDMDNGETSVAGTLDASAPNGGNGGFIETSASKVSIAPDAKITTLAASGETGTWLLDPYNITIVAAGTGTVGSTNYTASADSTLIDAGWLNTTLGNNDVILATGNDTVNTTQAGDITVNAAITWGSAHTLTLSAYRNIVVNAAITATGVGAGLVLNANNADATGGTYTARTGANLGTFSTAMGTPITLSGANTTLTIAGQAYTLIHDVTQLQSMRGSVVNLAKRYALGNDIDASITATSTWNSSSNSWVSSTLGFTPVGDTSTQFTGTFDGLGHTISSLTINRPTDSQVGLFGYTQNASIARVGILGGSVKGLNDTGELVGLAVGGNITQSFTTGSVTGSGTTGRGTTGRIGGLVGYAATNISQSYATGSVSSGSSSSDIGGLVGFAYHNANISQSYATGSVSSVFSSNIGGLVGTAFIANISQSYATGSVSSVSSNYTGGLVGYASSANISQSYATGSVSTRFGSVYTGGLVGYASSVNISQSYATGSVSGDPVDYTGGLVGYLVGYDTGSTFTNNFWDTQTTGQTTGTGNSGTPAGMNGLTTAQSRTSAAYTGWDFSATGAWFQTADLRPILRSEYSTTITNAHQLQLMAIDLTASYTLASNIDASATAGTNASGIWGAQGFSPVGNGSVNFTGTFDGLGHTITGLTINRSTTDYVGLFGYTSGATISRVGLVGGSITGQSFTGGLVGEASNGSISQSYATGSVSGINDTGGLVGYADNGSSISQSYATGSVSGSNHTGGLVGLASNGSISQSYATGSVSGSNNTGGLVGYANNGSSISQSYATGSVSGSNNTGGLVGLADNGSISQSYATGSVSGDNFTGGLVGEADNTNISQSYATGSVSSNSGSHVTGGLVGFASNGSISQSYATGSVSGTNDTGGLVGSAYYGSISQSYATGAVSGSNYTGGLVGFASLSTFTNNFWDTQTTGQANGTGNNGTPAGMTGLTTTQMRQSSSFIGWENDINQPGSVWRQYDGYSNPLLTCFLKTLTVTARGATKAYNGTALVAGALTYSDTGAPSSGHLFGTATYGNNPNAGTYSLTGLYSDQQGYDINLSGASGTITPKTLTVTGSAANKTYDGNTTASVTGVILNGLVGTETLGVSVTGATFADKNVANGIAVTGACTLADGTSGGLASNYTVAGASFSGNANITPKTLTVTGSAANKTYDGNTTASVTAVILNGLVGTETLGVSVSGANFNSKDVSTANLVTGAYAFGTGANGGLASNYTFNGASFSGAAAITPKQLTVSGATIADKTYDGNPTATVSGVTLTGLVGSETLGFSAVGIFANKNADTDKAVAVSGITLANGTGLNAGLSGNYSLASDSFTGATGNITQRVLTISGTEVADKTYDGNRTASVTAGTLNNLVSGETLNVFTAGNFDTKDAGSGKSVAVIYGLSNDSGLASNYRLANETLTAGIAKRMLTTSGSYADSKTYDGTTGATVHAGSLVGLVGSETLSVFAFGNFVTADAATGKIVPTAFALGNGTGSASNYTIPDTVLLANIDRRAVTVTANAGQSKVYGNTDPAVFGYSVGGLGMVNNETLTGSLTRVSGENVSAYDITQGTISNAGNANSNYAITFAPGVKFDITQRHITLTSAAQSKTYDGTTTAIVTGGAFGNLANGETLTVSASGTFADKNVGTGKAVTASYTLGNGTGLASNYTLDTPAPLTADITARMLTHTTSSAANKVYDGNTDAGVTLGAFTNLVSGDDLSVVASGSFADKNAGTGKTVTASYTLSGTDAGNYTLAGETLLNAANITPLALTIGGTIVANKVYDGNKTATVTAGTLGNVVLNDGVTVAGTGLFSDKNVADGKTVTASYTLSGTDAGNYTLAGETLLNAANITPLALTIGGTIVANKVYDGNKTATVTAGTLGNVVLNDGVTVAGTGLFSDKNVADGKTVTASYTLSGTDAGNYTLAGETLLNAANITPLALTIGNTTVASKVYDGNKTATVTAGTLGNVVLNDGVTVAGTGLFSDKNVADGKTVTASYTLSGTDAGNYTLAGETLLNAANITPLALTIGNTTVASKVYDGNKTATVTAGTLGNVVLNDGVTVAGTGLFSDKNVADGKTVTASYTLSGTDAGNYTLAGETLLNAANITPHALTIGGTIVANKVYDGNKTATVTAGTLGNVVLNDGVTVAGTGLFSDKNVADGKTVTASYTLSGTDAGNYTLAGETLLNAANITPLALTHGVSSADNKVYDGNRVAGVTVGTLGNVVLNDVVTVAGTGLFSDKNVADGKTVTASYTLTGTDAGNYTLAGEALTANITPLALTHSASTAANKVYDGNRVAGVTVGTLGNVVLNDVVTVAGTGLFSDKNVADGKTVTASYTLTGTDAGNYTLAGEALTANITPLALTHSASTAANKVYDGNTDAGVTLGAFTNFVTGDDLSVVASGSFADKNAGTGKTVTASYALSGTDAGNYTLAGETLTADITPKDITVTAAPKSKHYGNADPAFTYSVGGLLGSDTLTGALARASGELPGDYAIFQGSLAASLNYTMNYTGADLSIVAPITQVAGGTLVSQIRNPNGDSPTASVALNRAQNPAEPVIPSLAASPNDVVLPDSGGLLRVIGSGQRLPEGL